VVVEEAKACEVVQGSPDGELSCSGRAVKEDEFMKC
jgi:hypothetical protein